MDKQIYLLEKNARKKKISGKKEWKNMAAHIFALLKNMSATPTSLLLIKRSSTPPSLPILGVAGAVLKRVLLFNTLLLVNLYFCLK